MSGWLAECSIEAVSAALADVCPDLAALPIVLHDSWVETGNPLWARSTAFIDGAWAVKFAWTEAAAAKLEREIQTLRALATSDNPPPVRHVHASSSDPVLLISPFVAGVPVTGAAIERFAPTHKQHLADGLARVLGAVHDIATRDAVVRSKVDLPTPTPQADTTELRERFARCYERLTGRHVVLDRVMAWHIRTVLGDALWRTDAKVELPEGGTPTEWIDELDERLNALNIMPNQPPRSAAPDPFG